jgi:methylthioribose-1-phosphate isomerase
MAQVSALAWTGQSLRLLDQRVLPLQERYLECVDADDVAQAIRAMVVRGAPAIGIAAAYGAVLSARLHGADTAAIQGDLDTLQAARPTAVNLMWAVARMRRLVLAEAPKQLASCLLAEAQTMHRSDYDDNLVMARFGADVLATTSVRPFSVLTHCNAGSLATAGHGTALGVIRTAWQRGLIAHVHVDETRPWLQGSRLTAWELMQEDIPVSLNADSAAAWLLARGEIRWVIVGADRITACGDVANKIGTYGLAILARYHRVRVMVVAPTSTVDLHTKSGQDIEIEHRSSDELGLVSGQRIAPVGVAAENPVFDVTPARLIDVLVTEKGVLWQPDAAGMQRLMSVQRGVFELSEK